MNRALGDLKNNAHQLKWLHNIFSTASKAHVSMKRSYGIFFSFNKHRGFSSGNGYGSNLRFK